jgi:HEAT repeat protein
MSHNLKAFAARHPAEAAALVPNIVAALPESDCGEEVDLAIALRSIGPRAAAATAALRPLMRDNSPIVRIHAASALARIQPNDQQSRNLLLRCLSHESAHARWATAYAIGQSDIGDPRFLPALTKRLEDKDVRVRVTAADALWEITGEAADLVPVLIAALSEEHKPLATDFIAPSYTGESHRWYALRTLGKIGEGARSATAAVLAQIKETADDDRRNYRIAFVGLAALRTLASLGPHEPEVIAQVNKIRDCKGGFVERFPDQTRKLIARIEAKTEEAR